MFNAYISFDPSLKTVVETLQTELEKRNFKVHFEIATDPEGKQFNQIRSSIDKSKVFICCVTKSYAKNASCLNEIDYADGTRKPIVVLMFENASYKDLDHLGYLIAGLHVCAMYEDREKAYLKGSGPQFEQVIERLEDAEESNGGGGIYESPVAGKQFELYICYDHSDATAVEAFAQKLADEKKQLRVSYDHYKYKNKNRKAKFSSIKQSKAFLALITKGFLKSRVCLEEITYAKRANLQIFVLIDANLKLDEILSEAIQGVVSSNDLSVLEKSLDKVPFMANIEKLQD